MNRIVQVLGSVRIFTPFIAAQRGWVTTASNADLTRNFVEASVLTVLVGHERQYCGQSRRRMNCCGPLDRPRRGSFSTIPYLPARCCFAAEHWRLWHLADIGSLYASTMTPGCPEAW